MNEKRSATGAWTREAETAGIDRHEVAPGDWPEFFGPVLGARRALVTEDCRADSTAYGGLALAHELASAVGLPAELNERLDLLQRKRPYHESDHVLVQAYNLYVGGECLDDLQNLQCSTAIRRMLGAARLPDPTTAGDFLRRFSEDDLRAGQAAVDACRERVWAALPQRERRTATVDMDSTFKAVYGSDKHGADFNHKGQFSYHPLLLTLAETGECLRMINRSGNVPSARGVRHELRELTPMLQDHFDQVYWRGDSKFCESKTVNLADEFGVRFAFVKEAHAKVKEIANSVPEGDWRQFHAHLSRTRKRRWRGKAERRKDRIAKERGYRNLSTKKEWITEVPYRLSKTKVDCRLIIKRKELEIRDRQGELFTDYRYHFVLTNIPKREMSTSKVVLFCYARCDQENAIEQAKNGLGGLRMPTGQLLSNGAFMLCAQIAWNLRAWLSLTALPAATRRWEWKAFRHAFVYVAARVVETGRRLCVRLSRSHRWRTELFRAHERVRQLAFT